MPKQFLWHVYCRLNARAKVETHSKIRGHYKQYISPLAKSWCSWFYWTACVRKYDRNTREDVYPGGRTSVWFHIWQKSRFREQWACFLSIVRLQDFKTEIQAPLKALSRKLWRNAWSTKIACVNYGFSSRPKYLDQIGWVHSNSIF
jgi:hypothetical protein